MWPGYRLRPANRAPGRAVDLLRQSEDAFGVRESAAVHAHVQFSENVKVYAGRGCRGCQWFQGTGIVDGNGEMRSFARELGKAIELLFAVRWIGEQQMIDAGFRHHCSFGALGNSDAVRTRMELHARDLGDLVGLGVRAQFEAFLLHILSHARQIFLQLVQVDTQRGRLQFVDVHWYLIMLLLLRSSLRTSAIALG